MTRYAVRVLGCSGAVLAIIDASQYAGAPAFSYQGWALAVTLLVFVFAYQVGASQRDEDEQTGDHHD